MGMSNAEKQAAWRARRAQELADCRRALVEAQAEVERLRNEVAALTRQVEEAPLRNSVSPPGASPARARKTSPDAKARRQATLDAKQAKLRAQFDAATSYVMLESLSGKVKYRAAVVNHYLHQTSTLSFKRAQIPGETYAVTEMVAQSDSCGFVQVKAFEKRGEAGRAIFDPRRFRYAPVSDRQYQETVKDLRRAMKEAHPDTGNTPDPERFQALHEELDRLRKRRGELR